MHLYSGPLSLFGRKVEIALREKGFIVGGSDDPRLIPLRVWSLIGGQEGKDKGYPDW